MFLAFLLACEAASLGVGYNGSIFLTLSFAIHHLLLALVRILGSLVELTWSTEHSLSRTSSKQQAR